MQLERSSSVDQWTTPQSAAAAASAGEKHFLFFQELKALLKQSCHLLYVIVIGFESSTLTDTRRHLAALASCDKASGSSQFSDLQKVEIFCPRISI